MTLRIPLSKAKGLFLISAYAPTMTNPDIIKEQFYEDLRNVLLKVSPHDTILLMGDFNARVGSDHQTWPRVVGKHLLGNSNSNGLLLLSVCNEFNLTITNSLFQQANKFKGTWRHPRSKHWHTLDYIITRQSEQNAIKITRAHRGTELWSDHRLVRSKVKIRLPRKPRKAKCVMPKKLNCKALSNPETASNFSKELDKAMENCVISNDIESSWKSLKDTVYETSADLLGFPRRKNQDWFNENDEKTTKLINEMHQAHIKYFNNKNSIKAKNLYYSLKGTAQRRLRCLKEE